MKKKALSAHKHNRIIVILGPTSSGKSGVAIQLAKKFGGEIISADSRQIYRGMDVGTGKVTKAEQEMAKHYGIDIVNPKTEYNVAKFKKYADKIMKSDVYTIRRIVGKDRGFFEGDK